ncbi:uncharacterized protein LOC143039923 [Oratosquilla oratoria]|uniref:uncharacterized protein LOC143039923 n=1 Tax=Oratosquilla oratoria TaxID=337810 RepID=UPI003F7715C1
MTHFAWLAPVQDAGILGNRVTIKPSLLIAGGLSTPTHSCGISLVFVFSSIYDIVNTHWCTRKGRVGIIRFIIDFGYFSVYVKTITFNCDNMFGNRDTKKLSSHRFGEKKRTNKRMRKQVSIGKREHLVKIIGFCLANKDGLIGRTFAPTRFDRGFLVFASHYASLFLLHIASCSIIAVMCTLSSHHYLLAQIQRFSVQGNFHIQNDAATPNKFEYGFQHWSQEENEKT